MRNATTAARLVLGGYLAAHGAQKLFGLFGGHGLDGTAKGFESFGLTPGREMALLAGVTELGGGLLTATHVADPLGPLALAGTMTVASAVHRKGGPLSANGGFELPLTNLALAAVLTAIGPAGRRIAPLPSKATAAAALGAVALTGYALVKVLTAAPPPAPAEQAAS